MVHFLGWLCSATSAFLDLRMGRAIRVENKGRERWQPYQKPVRDGDRHRWVVTLRSNDRLMTLGSGDRVQSSEPLLVPRSLLAVQQLHRRLGYLSSRHENR